MKNSNVEANSKCFKRFNKQFTDHVSIFFLDTLLACVLDVKQNKKLNISKSILFTLQQLKYLIASMVLKQQC